MARDALGVACEAVSRSSGIQPGSLKPQEWRGFVLWLVASALALGLSLWAALLALDPFDTGRFASLISPGGVGEGPRTSHVGRGRSPTFDAAILGNSHVQLLSPRRLSDLSALNFVSLTVPGSGVREKLALLDWFLTHRQGHARALVLGLDDFDCATGPGIRQVNPFPFWLYGRDNAAYAASLFRYHAIEAALMRMNAALRRTLRPPDDGFQDYEAGRTWRRPSLPAVQETALQQGDDAVTKPTDLPGWTALSNALAALPAETRIVLVFPPRHVSARPPAVSREGRAEAACKDAVDTWARRRPNVAVVDQRDDDPRWADPDLFWDATHMRRAIAAEIEDAIASALARLGIPP